MIFNKGDSITCKKDFKVQNGFFKSKIIFKKNATYIVESVVDNSKWNTIGAYSSFGTISTTTTSTTTTTCVSGVSGTSSISGKTTQTPTTTTTTSTTIAILENEYIINGYRLYEYQLDVFFYSKKELRSIKIKKIENEKSIIEI